MCIKKPTSAEQGSWQKLAPSHGGCGCSAAVRPTGSAWDGSCCGAHKVPGCAYRDFLLLGSFPAMAVLPALPMLADMEQQCYHDVFPLTGCWEKTILSSWDFHRDATIFLRSSFSIYFLYFEILRSLNAANALLAPHMETWMFYSEQVD